MKKLFVNVETESHYADILFNSWDELVLALRAYGSGRVAEARHAFSRMLSEMPGDGAAFALLTGFGDGDNAIVEKVLLPKFEKWRKKRDHYYKCGESFDYNGGSRFHKTSVDVMDLGDGFYALGLYAAYVGREPENKLAEALGLPQALWWTRANATGSGSDVKDGYYRMPVGAILERLSVVPELNISVKQQVESAVFQLMDAAASDVWNCPYLVLLDDGNLSVTLGFDSMTIDIPHYRTWGQDGDMLLCPLRACKYADEIKQYGKMRQPVWMIEVRASRTQTERLPLWKTEDVEDALELAGAVAGALKA